MNNVIDITRNDLLKQELKSKYVDLSEAEINRVDTSFEQLIANISAKTRQQKDEVARQVEESVAYAKSKTL
ncbi:MAG: hypothetical protein KF775_17050 [Cyclobacteriaceae bacterium]|nr:hypothetical protein [Cytophagales bacterium]MBX2901364.1 hypothetical protein [Cyclobacteriaceae bacterium]